MNSFEYSRSNCRTPISELVLPNEKCLYTKAHHIYDLLMINVHAIIVLFNKPLLRLDLLYWMKKDINL